MNISKKYTAYNDKYGNPIHEGDICKTWIEDKFAKKGGDWLFEQVQKYNDNWCLFELGFDYSTHDDEPVLLENYLSVVEVTQFKEFSEIMPN